MNVKKFAIRENDRRFSGCDFVVELDCERENTKIRILQLTDTQIIDTENRPLFVIGVDVPAKDSDFGFKMEKQDTITTPKGFTEYLKKQNVEGVFVGHSHDNNTCIRHDGIVWTFGMKTGQYDY